MYLLEDFLQTLVNRRSERKSFARFSFESKSMNFNIRSSFLKTINIFQEVKHRQRDEWAKENGCSSLSLSISSHWRSDDYSSVRKVNWTAQDNRIQCEIGEIIGLLVDETSPSSLKTSLEWPQRTEPGDVDVVCHFSIRFDGRMKRDVTSHHAVWWSFQKDENSFDSFSFDASVQMNNWWSSCIPWWNQSRLSYGLRIPRTSMDPEKVKKDWRERKQSHHCVWRFRSVLMRQSTSWNDELKEDSVTNCSDVFLLPFARTPGRQTDGSEEFHSFGDQQVSEERSVSRLLSTFIDWFPLHDKCLLGESSNPSRWISSLKSIILSLRLSIVSSSRPTWIFVWQSLCWTCR